MPRVSRTRQAQRDLEEILEYHDARSVEAADRFAAKFSQACELHAENPQIGASAEVYAADLRCFTVWNHAIFYRPLGDGVEVIRIISWRARHPEALRARSPKRAGRVEGGR